MQARKTFGIVAVAATLQLIGACATNPTDGPPESIVAPANAATEPGETRPVAVESTAELSALDALLAQRRRGDFPEIETQETGFSITENLRISGSTYARYDEALSLVRTNRLQEGIAALQALTETAPELTAPYVDLGIAQSMAGDYESAAIALESAIALSPDHPVAHNELGIVYRRLGRFEDARREYEQALAVYGEFHFARRNLAVLCDLYLADSNCAIENYRLYLQSYGQDEEVEIWIADISARIGMNGAGENL